MMGALRKQSRRFVAEWLALGVMLLIIATVLAGALYRDRGGVEAREADRLQTQARVIDENLMLQLAGADKALLGIGAELKGADLFAPVPSLLPKLKLLTDAQPGVSSMLVMDSAGTVVAASLGELTGKNFRQREYFEAPRRGADPAMLYVSPPFRTTLGNYIVVISRALTDEQGALSGVITATLDTNYFTGLLRSVLYAPDMRTTLIHRDGKVFLSTPVERAADGLDPAALEAALDRHLRSERVTTLTTSRDGPSGEERLVAMRTIERGDLHINKAMIVAVSRSLADVYLPWWDRVRRLVLLLVILTIGSSTALTLHHRRRRTWGEASEAIERERQLASERVELALRGADLGLWDLHVPSGAVVVNARERALLGYAEGAPFPQGAEWRQLIHPDDLAHVDAAIVPHLRGEVAAYECVHRMRHGDGHDVWLSSRAMIVERAPDGAPIRIVGTHLDISERKGTEERLALASARLRESEEELRLATDNMPALVSRLDTEQRFRFANRAYSEWLHLDPAALIGKSLAEVYGDEAYATFRPHVERALGGERVVYERELRTPFGAKWVEVTLVPQSDHDGAVKCLYALINDITARHEAELRLAMSEQRLTLALECSGLALFDWNIAAGTMYHSAQAAVMRGDPPEEITAPVAELQAFVHPADMPAVLAQMKAALTGAAPVYVADYRLRRRGDDWLWIRAHGRVVQRDAAGRALRLAGTYTDINDAKIAEGRLRRLAEFDTLTGLPNRALFNDRLRQGMARAARGKPLALLFLDIDRFKSINDSFGHEAGDKLLKVFAGRMLGAVRQSDTVARLAGDEFTIILEQLASAGDAKAVARKLVEALRQPIAIAGRMLEVTVSIGVALCAPGDGDDVALLRRADEALYEAKRRGRDGFHCDDVEATFETQAAAGSSAVH
jgi:diguanylate cyclase (GGDEF)-like protein/PAS domain S-box-containing protein